jgi:hypothetical protein
VALNVTAVGATRSTYLTVWPDGAPRPAVRTLNPNSPAAVANFDLVAVGADGYIDVYNAAGAVNVLADLAGYFA